MKNTIISLFLILLTIYFGNKFTKFNTNTNWYECIRSDMTPPNYVFPIVWTFLYVLLGISFKKILDSQNKIVISLFIINLLLNISWTYLYFYKKNVKGALINIIVLIIISLIILNYKTELKYYLFPYILWLSFASYLNYDSIDKINYC
jgi:tryptophan-rich sensory protein